MQAASVHAPSVVVSQRTESPGPVDDPDILPFAFMNKQQYSNYRRKLWDKNPTCFYCHKRMAWKNATLDHVLPKSHGGIDTPSNLLLCCEGCNGVKAARSMVEWAQDLIQACAATGQTLAVEIGGIS